MGLNERTFGVEIEMCNVDKEKVSLPNGYMWSKDEKIFNTDAKISKRFGGEVNTPPLLLCQKDRAELKSVFTSLVNAGGKLKWSIDTHVHIFAGDLELDQLKNIFYLLYHCYKHIKRYCKISDWDEKVFNAQPIVTEEHYNRVKNAKTLNELDNVFANQSNKHYLRLAFNISSFFVRKTIEFRCFHATDSFSLLENCIIASYRMFLYSISHTEDDFQQLISYDDFTSELKLPKETPPLLVPLVYQGNPYDPVRCFMAKPLKYNTKLGKVLTDQKINDICVVGNLDYAFALLLSKKVKVSIYSQNLFTHLLYLISTGKLEVRYKDKLEWLNQYVTKDTVRQVVLAMFVSKIRNYITLKNPYAATMFESFKGGILKSISEFEKDAKRMIDFFNSVDYHFGTLNEAIQREKSILYQFGHDKRSVCSYRTMLKYSNIDLKLKVENIDYDGLVERIPKDVSFYMFSDSPYLSNLNKVAVLANNNIRKKSAGVFLYSNQKENVRKATIKNKLPVSISFKTPPSDLVIDDVEKLGIFSIPTKQLYELQKNFVKKVDKMSLSSFAYVVMYDGYILGGFGFTFPRGPFADLWQLADFCTNNEIPRLSKFILFCIKSKIVQSDLSRRINGLVESVITYAYTSNPVSMKYRGEYKKDKELSVPMRLAYKAKMGTYKTKYDIISRYKEVLK